MTTALKPPILNLYDNFTPASAPRLHWYDRPGGGWTQPTSLPLVLSEVTVHWRERNTPPGQPDAYYIDQVGQDAYFHAFQRDWEPEAPGFQGSDGIQYHYAIAPNGLIMQVSPETHRTWNSFESNAHNLAVEMLAGPGDTVQTAAVMSLHQLLDWFCFGRPDLPLVRPVPGPVPVLRPDGHTGTYQSAGVCTHDESLARWGRPPKGCCGIYAPVVKDWRRLAVAGRA